MATATSYGTLLLASGLTKHFGGLPALHEVRFRAEKGQVTALIGPNGAGKTTFINCLTGLLRPDKGSMVFDGRELSGLPPHRIARLGISRTFQNLRLFPRLSVLDNVLCGLSTTAGDSLLEARIQVHPGLPVQARAGPGDVGLAYPRVVHGQRIIGDRKKGVGV